MLIDDGDLGDHLSGGNTSDDDRGEIEFRIAGTSSGKGQPLRLMQLRLILTLL